ncbi:MAG: DUF488 family protein, partial [Thermodesulfobacteriota bacterium]
MDEHPLIFTIGHSTRSLETFIQILKAYQVKVLVDVRKIPRSKHNPQFNQESFPQKLNDAGLKYLHMPRLGGFRRPKPDSRNLAWRSPGFRGFADYMESREFEENLEELIRIANQQRVSIMCAEALPWRCHRSLLSDALMIRGFRVEHILSLTQSQPHRLHSF